MKKIILIISLITIGSFAFSQKKGKSENKSALVLYNEGLEMFNNGKYKEADSLFSRSSSLLPHRDTYFNLALTKYHLNDTCGFCNNLQLAKELGDEEADGLIAKRCLKRDTMVFNSAKIKDTVLLKVISTTICTDKKSEQYFIRKLKDGDITEFSNQANDSIDLKRKMAFAANFPEANQTFEIKPYSLVEQMPDFPGGEEALMNFLKSNVIYPMDAKERGIQGTVYVSFVVKADGQLASIGIIKGIGGGCDEECIRVVRLMPKWKPGKQSGVNVPVYFNLPIKFMLN